MIDKHSGESHAGLIESKRRRYTGTVVNIYRAEEALMDPAGGPYTCICQEHGTICNFQTLWMARHHAVVASWCEPCSLEVWCQTDEEERND
jgi:hypothetical protein